MDNMTKAEERALEAYPVNMTPLNYQDLIEQFGGKAEIDINTYPRRLFQEGYEQAEKDLAYAAQIDGFFYGKGYQQAEKDLIEWVEEQLAILDKQTLLHPDDDVFWGQRNAYKQMRDKLNSL